MAKKDANSTQDDFGSADELLLDEEQHPESPAEDYDVDMAIVKISRDASTTTPTTVFAVEIPILEAIHGEENVDVHRESTGRTRMNAAELHAQLLTKYRQNQEEVKALYPTPRAVQRATGLPYTKGDSRLAKPKQSSVLVGGKEVDPIEEELPPAD